MKQQVIEHFAWGIMAEAEMPDSFDEARDQLMPVVKERLYHSAMMLRCQLDGEPGLEFPANVFAEHFVVTVAYDLPNRVLYAGSDRFAEWGVTLDQALEVAIGNLGAPGLQVAGVEGHIYTAASEDVYNASRILLADKIRKLKVQGRHVAAIPHRETLIITGSEDVKGLEMLAQFIDEAREQPRFQSGITLVLEDDGWAPFLPPEDSPAYPAMHKQFIGTLFRDYAEQKELLDTLHEQTLTDIFVASYTAYEDRDSGRLWTTAVWSEGVDTLLPQAETVAFAAGASENPDVLGMAPWQRVVDVAGELMQPTDHYPPRRRIQEFPTQEQLDALKLDRSPFA